MNAVPSGTSQAYREKFANQARKVTASVTKAADVAVSCERIFLIVNIKYLI